jgi:mycothiol system anti-sigma-R factor
MDDGTRPDPCGDPAHGDCAEVLGQVYVYLDGEIDSASMAEIRHHLDECSPCLRQYGLEQEVKALIARACGCEHAPDAMRDRLLARLREVRVEISRVEYTHVEFTQVEFGAD